MNSHALSWRHPTMSSRSGRRGAGGAGGRKAEEVAALPFRGGEPAANGATE